ncbi:DUF7512 family protein [Natronococcus jeotgali]
MTDWDAESPATGCRLSASWVVLISLTVVSLSLLSVAPILGESGQAVTTVGYVLAEALVLYVGYGVLAWVANPVARKILVST